MTEPTLVVRTTQSVLRVTPQSDAPMFTLETTAGATVSVSQIVGLNPADRDFIVDSMATISDDVALADASAIAAALSESNALTYKNAANTSAGDAHTSELAAAASAAAAAGFANPRVDKATTQVSPWTWNSDDKDYFKRTAIANDIVINADAGTAQTEGKKIQFYFLGSAVRVLTFKGGAKGFRPVNVPLTPSGSDWTISTVASKRLFFTMIWNTDDNVWDVLGFAPET